MCKFIIVFNKTNSTIMNANNKNNKNDINIDNEYIKFIIAYDNYDLYDNSELYKFATKTFINIKNYDFDEAKTTYDEFMNIIFDCELEGTSDLVDPIRNMYYSIE